MKRFHAALALAGVLMLAAPAAAQREGGPPAPGAEGRGRMLRNPVKILLDSAQVLGLNDDQRAELALVAEQLDSANAPVLAELQKRRPQGGAGGGRGFGGGGEPTPEQLAAFEQLRPLMQQLRDNSQAALASAFAVLTPQQREKAQGMLPRRRMGGDRGGEGGGGEGGPPQG